MINDFEKMLHENGTRILKFYLHISPAEQLERFKQRFDDPPRHWKISETDYSERELWPDYIGAVRVSHRKDDRLRRMVIGLGVGQATLNTKVQVYQMASGNTTQILDFTTHADSGNMPGAALTAPAGAAAGGAVAAASLAANLAGGAAKTYTSSSGYLAKKTADQSVTYMSQYFAQQGWPA